MNPDYSPAVGGRNEVTPLRVYASRPSGCPPEGLTWPPSATGDAFSSPLSRMGGRRGLGRGVRLIAFGGTLRMPPGGVTTYLRKATQDVAMSVLTILTKAANSRRKHWRGECMPIGAEKTNLPAPLRAFIA